jgi:hypothetical protein
MKQSLVQTEKVELERQILLRVMIKVAKNDAHFAWHGQK